MIKPFLNFLKNLAPSRQTGRAILTGFFIVQLLFGYMGSMQVNTVHAQLIPNALNSNTSNTNSSPADIKVPVYSGVEDSIKNFLCVPDDNNLGTALFDCISKVYRFGIAFGGIALVFFIVFAGYLYIAGGEASKGKGKTIFTTALTGMAIILSSYVLLRFINPNLVIIKPIQTPIFQAGDLPRCEDVGFQGNCVLPSGQVMGGGVSGSGDVTVAGYSDKNVCGDSQAGYCKASYPNNRCTAEVVTRCRTSEYQGYFDQGIQMYQSKGGKGISGLDMKTLVTSIATVERGCTKTGATSGAGAAGMMQFIQSSAKLYAPRCGASVGSWPGWANDNPVIQVCMAAFHLEDNAKLCGNQVRNIAAGYNAGAGRCQTDNSSECKSTTSCGGGAIKEWECKCGWWAKETAEYGPMASGCYYNAFK